MSDANRVTVKKAFIMFIVLSLVHAQAGTAFAGNDSKEASKLEDFSGRRVGCLMGSVFPGLIMQTGKFSEDTEMPLYNTEADLVEALKSEKVDAIALDEPDAYGFIRENKDLMLFQDFVAEDFYGFAFQKTAPLSMNLTGQWLNLKPKGWTMN